MGFEELGEMSPGDIDLLREAWRRREMRRDLRAGQICWILAEVNRSKESRAWPFHAADFFPSLEALRPDGPSDEEMAAKLDAMATIDKTKEGRQ